MPIKIESSILTDETTYQNIFYQKILGDSFEVHTDRSTDGYIDGTIFEHKQNVSSYGKAKALSQALIYLCRFNRDGVPVPKNIMLVSQDEKTVYLYDANDYIDIINNIPEYSTLQASKGIEGFIERKEPIIINYDLDDIPKCLNLIKILDKIPEYIKVNITVHNVYGWSQYFYNVSDRPTKVRFFKEIRKPKKELADFINPWTGEETDFSLIMDLLNDPAQQKKLGAFYTPPLYARKAVELVRSAIKNIPKGNDYIILDRCAGTGALEYELTEEELSHVIINTYELKEWHALKDRLGKLVRYIIPPIPIDENKYPDYDLETGFLSGANALDKDFLQREEILKYIKDPNCNIILFENPPYADDSADTPKTGESRGSSKNNFIAEEMNKKVKPPFPGLVQSKDIANLFIWSGFEYYLTKPNDAYILFSPIKYWKTGHLVNKKFIKGFIFNREHFHAGDSAISCIYWDNSKEENLEQITLEAYDIIDNKLSKIKNIEVKKVHKTPNKELFDKRVFNDDIKNGIYSQRNGLEGKKTSSTGTQNIYNENIIGWLHLIGFAFDPKNLDLTRNTLNLRKNGFYLRSDNYIEKLPLFCAKAFPQDVWYETDIYSTSGDKGDEYVKDKEFLKKCLIYTCLTQKNRCRSLNGSDGRYYKNELCFEENTLATKAIQDFIKKGIALTSEETELINEYKNILKEIKKKDKKTGKYICEEYNEKFTYGTYQISDEINVSTVIGYDKKGKEKYGPKYGDLNNRLISFKKKVQQYYNNNIIEDLFKYELLK